MSSTFEKYHKEVMAGRLDWTPAHTNETIWRDNINAFEKNEFELIRYVFACAAFVYILYD